MSLPYTLSTGNLPKPVRTADKVGCWSLLRVGRQENSLSQLSAESFNAAREVEAFQGMKLSVVQEHPVLVVEINQSGVKCPVIGWRQGNAVSYVIGASGRSDRQDVGGIDKPKLHPRNCAAVAISKQDSLPEVCGSA